MTIATMVRCALASLLLAGCFPTPSEQFTCTGTGRSQCDNGRTCEQGFCIVAPIDAPVFDMVAEPDAPPDARPCTGGDAHVQDPGGACFVFFMPALNRANAEAACVGLDMHLAAVHSDAQNDLVKGIINNRTSLLGANDINVEMTFVYPDATPFDYDNFRNGVPNNGNGNEDCIVIEGNAATWDDQNCNDPFSYVCGFVEAI